MRGISTITIHETRKITGQSIDFIEIIVAVKYRVV